jgi:hypothetical protein
MTTDTAVLELETSIAGKQVNGVDIIGVHQHEPTLEFTPPGDPVTTSAGSPLAPDTQAIT